MIDSMRAIELAEHGEDVVIRRWSGTVGACVATEVVARGRPFGLKAEQLVGNIRAGDCKVVVINDPAANVPSGKGALATLLPLTTSARRRRRHRPRHLRGRLMLLDAALGDAQRHQLAAVRQCDRIVE
jgi:hypothetical protein